MTPPTRSLRRGLPALAAATLGITLVATGLPAGAKPGSERITLEPIGTYVGPESEFDTSAAEIVAYDAGTERLFVVNAQAGRIDVLDISAPATPVAVGTITAELAEDGAEINSVAVRDGLVAAAVQAPDKHAPGSVELFDAVSLLPFGTPLEVGALPDMLTFTPDGARIVVANEGEPSGYCDGDIDPEGSISIIDVDGLTVATADFHAFDGQADALRDAGVRIFGPGASVSEDLEPEYVAIDADSTTAWVSLQENNALAIVDLATATVTDIAPLGLKDHSLPGNGLDASDRDPKGDSTINIATWPVNGMYQPDAIDAYEHGNKTYIVSANEGDAREYDCYVEESRVKDLEDDFGYVLDGFDDDIDADENLGRLTVTTSYYGEPGPVDDLYSFGGRSFSIWDSAGELVFDSGDQFEQITAALLPEDFNSNNDENGSFESRSDNKGPEPEGVEIGRAYGKTYAFIGLERVGGVMVYDITSPKNPFFVTYVNNRDFGQDAETPEAGDLGPEGLTFIPAADSPNGKPLLVVGNEVSGSTTIYEIAGPGKAR
ncbi:choice-of-anchor I family protein [Acidimicrobiia bacterium EGI L10123]|nr:choice-of-anchor I family protein [Acidimicrobiia bacterium EGI L10123]